jgi:peroxiredoxin
LNERLAAFRSQNERLLPDMASAYDRLVARLDAIDRNEVGPMVGDRMPDFVLPDQSGTLVSLGSLLERGPLIVSFNRGHWCPYCKLDLRALAEIYPDISRAGGHAVSIMPDTARALAGDFPRDELPFPVLSDVDLGYTLSLGLIYWVGTEVALLYQKLGIELERYHSNDHLFLPLAAKFVLAQDGSVVARYVNVEFRERTEPTRLVSDVRGIDHPAGQVD